MDLVSQVLCVARLCMLTDVVCWKTVVLYCRLFEFLQEFSLFLIPCAVSFYACPLLAATF